jgi:hypothetical protein
MKQQQALARNRAKQAARAIASARTEQANPDHPEAFEAKVFQSVMDMHFDELTSAALQNVDAKPFELAEPFIVIAARTPYLKEPFGCQACCFTGWGEPVDVDANDTSYSFVRRCGCMAVAS